MGTAIADSFGEVAGWERQGVVISGDLPWEGSLLQDPCVVAGAPGGPPFAMWYGAIRHIGYATSDDGRRWVKSLEPVLSPTLDTESKYLNQPSVVYQDGLWHMTYFGADEQSSGRIHYASSASPSGPWTKHGPVLDATETWEDDFLYNSSLMYDADAGIWKLWYTAGKIASAGGEPRCINYATADYPAGPWRKHSNNPLISPMADDGWASLGIGGPNVSKLTDGSYEMYVTGWQASYPSRGGRLVSADGIQWRLARDAMVLDLGEVGGPEDSMVYRQFIIRYEGSRYLYYNAKNHRPGWNETINMAVWNDALSIIDPGKWAMTQGWSEPSGASFRLESGAALSLGNAPDGEPQTLQGNVLINSGDYEVSVDITPLSEQIADRENLLIARATGRDTYYYAAIASQGAKYSVGKLVAGIRLQIAAVGDASEITQNVTRSLTLSLVGSSLRLYDAGVLVLAAEDPTLHPTTSYVGLQTSSAGGRARFSKFAVTTPD